MPSIKEKLQNKISSLLENRNVVLFSSCRNALFTLVKSFNFQPDDEVIIQSFICDSLPQAIRKAGAKVVYASVDAGTLNLTKEEVLKKITKNTKAVIFVHTYGNPSGIKEVAELCKQRNLVLIEDIAHALGARYERKMAGTFGDYAVYSFTKQMVNFGGGALITDRDVKKIIDLQQEKIFMRHRLSVALPFIDYTKRLVASLYETRAFFGSKLLIDFVRKRADLRLAQELSSHAHCSKMEAFLAYCQIDSVLQSNKQKKENYDFLNSLLAEQYSLFQKVEPSALSASSYLSFSFQNKRQCDLMLAQQFLFLPPWSGSAVSDNLLFVPNRASFSEKKLRNFAKTARMIISNRTNHETDGNAKCNAKNDNTPCYNTQNYTKGIFLALICTVIVSFAQILLKKGSAYFSLSPEQLLSQLTNIPLLIGGALYILGAVFFIYAFRRGELSVIYPIMASGYIFVTLLSVFFLGEVVTSQKWVGLFLIIGGVVLLGHYGQRRISVPQNVFKKKLNNSESVQP